MFSLAAGGTSQPVSGIPGGGPNSGLQYTSDQRIQQLAFSKQSGSRTPSQQEMTRHNRQQMQGVNDFISNQQAMVMKQPNKHTLHLHSPIKGTKNIGSISLESGQLKDLELNDSPLLSRAAPKTDHSGQMRAAPASMAQRMRNQSEIADTRDQQNNYGSFDTRGASGGANSGHLNG